MSLSVVVLAAGKGTRMRSSLPKVLHPVAHKPMVQHVIDAGTALNASGVTIVYGHGGDTLKQALAENNANWALQAEQLGTGHAVKVAEQFMPDNDTILILYGDVPLIQSATLERLLAVKPEKGIALLTVKLDDPSGYGRIIRENGSVVGIIEQKDANPEQLSINEVNTGIMAVNGDLLKSWLNNLSNDNAQGEYYLTDIIAMANEQGYAVTTAHPDSAMEVEGANNRVQLAALEREYQKRETEKLMLAGASMRDPSRVDVRGDVTVGQDVELDINVVFEGKVTLGNNVVIGPNCLLIDCVIGDNTVVHANSIIESAEVLTNAQIGPFARLRPGAVVGNKAKVGNFVEMKKSTLGEGSKVNHFSYLGDTTVGQGVNIGAGVITANYDGVNKFKTTIEDNAFIGTNSTLVAPVTISANGFVAAGSTITKDVEKNALSIARGKQRNIDNWPRPVKG
ncbi:bifunctional UDP-N-acetylglucosamine diphosphorylase/glucosamine-1-phosphate N-acetyltransferase GlmU [Psychrosphaera sp. B3R10]|uniref:bifunctional UDP-N-acetylglucosamine diphosphorylase/glucosamine-1-phosphate N-acetyltransferase GlmU n=1 Tax=unclassified Psychrosphaera TaxID=2641570 RepID=UPI001C088392|nr:MULTISPECIES: bifunctional UDP-N-acetylglucosamine diphosphorylase/glucosamine-1-phosphate N-acetyltransferase GlmU [unclassified Psychrosphaera]MBU2883183.1 bifunctional UDP-N-acetylglucosamine diphosphorylase/glucosamine-1-phosphate N-acetyltransferase GlmU [Psychrosphaera sp. I2R16]MBU2988639.1 bifunctional UDP-N-acetylglucosamine diphosphorylase/glucosamine-1-phosphate N-acetyltransferase GlmU [Psychrosphaera sp. B3R10]MDO6719702.1 bifunctional UDP-N-acetylglucosamine diphosphorylase/gluc